MQYTFVDGALYYVHSDDTLRVIPPTELWEELFDQAHGGVYGKHLRDPKAYSELYGHYWWPKMRSIGVEVTIALQISAILY